VGTWSRVAGYLLLFPENRGQPTNLGPEGCTNMLRLIGDQLLNAGHDIVEEGLAFEKRAKA
jgi:hypothetical protein